MSYKSVQSKIKTPYKAKVGSETNNIENLENIL